MDLAGLPVRAQLDYNPKNHDIMINYIFLLKYRRQCAKINRMSGIRKKLHQMIVHHGIAKEVMPCE